MSRMKTSDLGKPIISDYKIHSVNCALDSLWNTTLRRKLQINLAFIPICRSSMQVIIIYMH